MRRNRTGGAKLTGREGASRDEAREVMNGQDMRGRRGEGETRQGPGGIGQGAGLGHEEMGRTTRDKTKRERARD
jgi:hypothetical protein